MDVTQIRMAQFYDGTTDDVFKTTHEPLPEVRNDEVKLRVDMISLDPGMRGWMTNAPSYMPPVQPGEIMRCFGIAEVLESKSKHLKPGDWVRGFTGVATHVVLPAKSLRKVDLTLAEPKEYLGALGMTAFTAYFGMTDIGQPRKGETVLVSAAAGAVGSVACQIAKLAGAHTVGIAGGPEKCAWLMHTLKLHGVIDYKNDDLRAALKGRCPDGVDVYFDNVGGDTLGTVLPRMNYKGRIVACGAISQYGDVAAARAKGPDNFITVILKSLRIQGFTMMDYMKRVPEAFTYMLEARNRGEIIYREHMLEGIENFEESLKMLYSGRNNGKLLLKVAA